MLLNEVTEINGTTTIDLVKYYVIPIGLNVLIWIVFCVSIWRLCAILLSKHRHQYPVVTKIIHVILPFALCALGINNLLSYLDGHYKNGVHAQTEIYSIIVGGLPGYLFVLSYLSLVLFWAVRYYRNSRTAYVAKHAYIALVVCVCSIWLTFSVLLIIFKTKSDNQTFKLIHDIEVIFAASIQYLASLAYLFIGSRLWCQMRHKPNKRQKSIQTVIRLLTVCCTFTFMLRATSLLLMYFYLRPDNDLVYIVVDLGHITLFELVTPVMMMIFLGRTLPKTAGARDYLVDQKRETSEYVPINAEQSLQFF